MSEGKGDFGGFSLLDDAKARRVIKQRIKQIKEIKKRKRARYLARKAFPIRQVCSVEGCNELGEIHHHNYNKPLEIVWLCRKHHCPWLYPKAKRAELEACIEENIRLREEGY